MTATAASNDHLSERLAFLELGVDEQAMLRTMKPLIMAAVGPSLDKFYEKVGVTAETARFFSSARHVAHAKEKQTQHWDVISSAEFGSEYARRIRAIGNTHAHLGLEPRWYIGGYALVADGLVAALVEELWPKMLGRRAGGAERMKLALGSLIKATMLDMDFAISIYLEVIDKERQEAEATKAKAARDQALAMSALSAALELLAAGDLKVQLTQELAPEFDQIKADFNRSVEKLKQTIQKVSGSAHGVSSGAREIAEASDDLARRTEQQAAALEQTAAALEEITATVRKASEGAVHASALVSTAQSDAKTGGTVVSNAVDTMHEIEKASGQISMIIGVIDEIAFQTNLLALNAGVEAARAGDAGRGFAVVATEVRALAQRTTEAAREIKTLITHSTERVSKGVDLVDKTGASLLGIIRQIDEINGIVADIAAGAKEQAQGLQQVNTAINEMDQTTQQNAAMVEEATAASHSLLQEMSQLTHLVNQFSTGEAQAPVVAVRPPQTAPLAVAFQNKAPAAPAPQRRAPSKPTAHKVAAAVNGSKAPVVEDGWKEF